MRISSFWRGVALVVFWVFSACIYQSYIRQESCLPLAMPSDRKVKKRKLLKRKRKRLRAIHRLPAVVQDAPRSQVQELEQQLNEMSIEVIELKMTQGIPNGL